MIKCCHCSAQNYIRKGSRKTKNNGLKAVYFCCSCRRSFSEDDGFKFCKKEKKAITIALDLRAKGLSLAQVKSHLGDMHGIIVSRQAISDWEKKFGKKIKNFTDTQKPQLGNSSNVDEVFLKVKGLWEYYYNGIDELTKFHISGLLSPEIDYNTTKGFFENLKYRSFNQIKTVNTDGRHDYKKPFKKVFGRKFKHVYYPARRKKFKNNPIERYHNTLKQRYKVMRGFKSHDSAQAFLDFFQIYYNFIRLHMSLNGKTPAEAAGIFLLKRRNNPWMKLIKLYQLIFLSIFNTKHEVFQN